MSGHDVQPPESIVAARNALTLGTSLAMTAGLALLVRLLIPRILGPASFGEFRLAESFAEMLFVVLTFGVDMHLRREAAVDPSQARRYIAGLTALRLGIGAAAIAGTVLLLRTMGSGDQVVTLFVVIALAQALLVLNNSYAALEHAAGDAAWLARTNVAAKVVWAVAVMAVASRAGSGLAIALTALAIEASRFVWFTARAVGRHQMLMRPDVRLAAGAMAASLPFFVNAVAHNLYARIGTGWLASACSTVEVGLYGAAASLASVALLGMPLLSWVLVPSAARAAAHSDGERDSLVAGALRLSLLLGVPLAVAMHLGATLGLQALFGAEYQSATPVLRIMAPTVGLAYLSTVCAIALIQRGQTWTVAGVSLGGVATTAALAAVLIPWGARALGPAGGAQGAAWATLGTEVLVTLALAVLSRTFWAEPRLRRTAAALAGGLVAFTLTITLGSWHGLGPAAAIVAFGAAVLMMGGMDRNDLAFCQRVLARSGRRVPATMLQEVS